MLFIWGDFMKRKNIVSSIFFSLILVLSTGCNKKETTKETGFIINTDEVKLVYKLGEELDLDGLKVYAAKEVGTYKELDDDDYKLVHTYNKDVLGSYKVEVQYKKFPVKYFYLEVEKFDTEAPTSIPTPTLTVESITMPNTNGLEYRIDNKGYEGKYTFDGLTAGSVHTIYARYKETATNYTSDEISQTFTLPEGPATMSLTLEGDALENTIGYIYFDVTITAKDNTGDDNLYISIIAPDLNNAKYQYLAGSEWITLDGNNLRTDGFTLANETIKFRVNNSTEATSTLAVKILSLDDDSVLVASNSTTISFILGDARATLLTQGDAIVDEAFEFEVKVELNDDTHLEDDAVYGQIDFYTSQIPNDQFTVEFYDEDLEQWVVANKTSAFQFNSTGMYLKSTIYKFRFTPVGQTYDNFTFYIKFKSKQTTTEVLSVKVVLDVIDVATVKGNALLELNAIDFTNYTGTKLEQAQEALEEVRSNISNATTGKEIYELLEEFHELIESL